MESRFYTAKDIANLLGVGVGKGYSLIREWNKKLQQKGYTTAQGRVVKAYADLKLGFGIQKEDVYGN